jgi:hypothetical protein
MAFALGRTERIRRSYNVAATLANGQAASIDSLFATLLPPNAKPTGTTVWTPVTLSGGSTEIVLTGPEAENKSGAMTVSAASAGLWFRAIDGDEVDEVYVERITVS